MLKQVLLAKLIAKHPGILDLRDLAGKDFKSFDLQDFARVFQAFGVQRPPSPELVQAAHVILTDGGVHNASDLIQSPEALEELLALITGGLDGFTRLQDAREGLTRETPSEESNNSLFVS